jgi:adenosylhomocysteine nucleosidase
MSAAESPVFVVTAMPEERAPLLARAAEVRRMAEGLFEARLGNARVVLAATGEGPTKAARGAAALFRAHRPLAFLGVGVAGAISEELSEGEILVSRRVQDDSGEAPPPDAGLLSRALAIAGVRGGTFRTTSRFASTAREKAALAAGLPEGPAAVDMESASWARAAAAAGVPYLVLRVIRDELSEEVPGYLSDCLDEEGSIRRSSVVIGAITHPWRIPDLLRMRSRVRDCGQRLAALVEHFLSGEAGIGLRRG